MSRIHRSSLSVTYGIWSALFLREATIRLSVGPAAIWILLNPVLHMVLLLLLFVFIRMKSVDGMDTVIWLMLGLLSYDMFRDTLNPTKNSIKASKVLFTYQQIKPIDVALVRACLEGFLTLLVAIILFTGVAFLGVNVLPVNPLAIFVAVFGLWLIGLAAALLFSVLERLIPASTTVINIIMMPLYICSGVIFPVAHIPPPYRDWLLYNPLLHGVEAARVGFSPYYHPISGINIFYLYGFALSFLLLGLALQKHFAKQMLLK